ncbi:MAG: transposase [Planctomycetia bacterium]|nr:transposase [Planctomycetia bacterium]
MALQHTADLRTSAPLGFVEGLNNKIRVIQRRAYGLRDEEYLRLKILTCMLPGI